ncbi:MAG: helix-turn-helix domain-containing protein [Pseudomonadota bacterium]
MGRPSKLSDKQWQEIKDRLVDGESGRALAKEFGVTETAIRRRLSSQVEKIKTVAIQLHTAEKDFNSLPVSSQVSAQSMLIKLREIGENLISAAANGAITANKLSLRAMSLSSFIGDGLDSCDDEQRQAMRDVMALGMGVNTHADLGLKLMTVSKSYPLTDIGKDESNKQVTHSRAREVLNNLNLLANDN